MEHQCNEIELSLRCRNWDRLGTVIAESRRSMHEFENAMADSHEARDDEFDRVVFARLQRVFAVRDEQMKRLQAINREIGDRLRSISKWKQYARAVAGPGRAARRASLFQDIR